MKNPTRLIKRKRDLRKNYLIRAQLGMILSLLIFIVVFKIEIKASGEKEVMAIATQEEVMIEEIVQTKQEIQAPPPPRPMVPVEVPNDEVIEDEIIALDAELELDEMIELPPPPPAQEEDGAEEEIFVVVEQPPVLIGGIQSVQSQVVYPELAIKAGIEGRVVLQFVIRKDGQITDIQVVRGIGGGCDEEAVRALKTAKFRPGMQRGRPVSVKYTIPVSFRIKKDNT